MKAWIISDTHTKHSLLNIPDGVDMVICAGDFSNMKDKYTNEVEVRNFLNWYKSLTHIKHKVLIAGNHDTSIEAGLINRSDIHESITYLNHESVNIEGINIFGSPYTPSFGYGWAYNVARHKIDEYWKEIPENTDILVTHGPSAGILDYTEYNGGITSCGDKSLLNHIMRVKPKYHIFGHIHNESLCKNAGKLQIQGLDTTFINASVVNLQYKIENNGYIIEI